MARSNGQTDQPRTILVVEDNPGDARLIREVYDALDLTERLRIVSTGSDALDFVNQRDEYADAPETDLVILDWHLPDMGGSDILEELNADPAHNHIPVIVSTGQLAEQEVRKVYEKNANACITKPNGPDELKEIILSIEAFWVSTARLPTVDDGNR
ncbi:response regulator [Natrinema halophilum]|uniref:Response regulator n=1 Tax=Natrinema halophilum TaxID=1699371 RepID=A0A7D5GH55_9EURY|nr:response regulator [Natrinema halophilum]QLG48794.1 response regulator [Natrinema halophilum]